MQEQSGIWSRVSGSDDLKLDRAGLVEPVVVSKQKEVQTSQHEVFQKELKRKEQDWKKVRSYRRATEADADLVRAKFIDISLKKFIRKIEQSTDLNYTSSKAERRATSPQVITPFFLDDQRVKTSFRTNQPWSYLPTSKTSSHSRITKL